MTKLDVGIISIMPEWIMHMNQYGVTGKAISSDYIRVRCWNPRDYSDNPQHKIDDKPYGGGAGMVIKVDPLLKALNAARLAIANTARTIYFSPQGAPIAQKDIEDFAKEPALLLVAGRYEGIDERALKIGAMEEWSIGDFVTSGGELPALCCLDAIARLLPNVLGNKESTCHESFNNQLLEHPHYTRPQVYQDMAVPQVLLGGDHSAIARWRLQQSLGRTWHRRRDLIDKRGISDEERALLDEYLKNGIQ